MLMYFGDHPRSIITLIISSLKEFNTSTKLDNFGHAMEISGNFQLPVFGLHLQSRPNDP